jgi:hypothetical protein
VDFAGIRVHPIDIFCVLVISEALAAFIAQLVAQIEPEVAPALVPPRIVNMKLGVERFGYWVV